MDVNLAKDAREPLHEQVAAAILADIADGQVRPGERLPPARDIAAVLGVHSNTVLKALRSLRDQGVLEFRRGRGVTVAGTPDRALVQAKVSELLDFARKHGCRREEIVSMIQLQS